MIAARVVAMELLDRRSAAGNTAGANNVIIGAREG